MSSVQGLRINRTETQVVQGGLDFTQDAGFVLTFEASQRDAHDLLLGMGPGVGVERIVGGECLDLKRMFNDLYIL